MKILHITASLGPGGAENILYKLASEQTRNGHLVWVLALCDEGFYAAKLREKGVIVWVMCRRKISYSRWWHSISLVLNWPIAFFRIWRLRPELIHTWMYIADLWGGLIGRILKKPVIWGIFSGSTDRRFYTKATYVLIKTCGFLSRWVPTSIVSCSAYGRDSHGDIGYPKTKMVFIPTGFRSDEEKVASSVPTSAIHPRPRGPITLGMLARISNEKEHILLLEGFRNLLDNGYDLELALAGGVGLEPGESRLEPVIARFGLGARVKLLGNVRNISEFLFSLDIFILLSGSEGFPTVVGEAMAHRRPCVVSDVGDSRVLLSDPLQLTKSDDMDSFIRRVSRIISMTAEERSMIGDRNYDRVARLFTLEKMMERYEAVYRHATKPRVK